MKNLPEKIYLQIGSDCDHDVDFNKLVGVTWNRDRINKNDVEYVRSDLLKWNKVEDCLPEMNQTVLVKRDSGRIGVCYFKSRIFVDTIIGLSVNVTEWKPIN